MKQARGFSMIEVLVSLVIICIGVLGMVSLQGRSIGYTQDSVQRNQASMLASDLLELMRANKGALYGSTYNLAATSRFYKPEGSAFPDTPEAGCSLMPANSDAAAQLGCWVEQVKKTLPVDDDLLQSEFHVCRSNAPGDCTSTGAAMEIQVAWRVKNGECLDASDDDANDRTVCRYRLRAEI